MYNQIVSTLIVALKMSNKNIAFIVLILGILILFSEHESSWIVSAIFLGIGSGLMFWKN
jgi:hypothetical protein